MVSLLAAAAAAVAAARSCSSANVSGRSELLTYKFGDNHDYSAQQHTAAKEEELAPSPNDNQHEPLSATDRSCTIPQTSTTNDASSQFTVLPHASTTSRNAAKTLKCPKCNWHYKYQETLEIHMREKHGADDDGCDASGTTMKQRIAACMYCQTQRPHPRLGRGETYSCGYKPYKCEVCNYSTTSKGNLSIHMQSDKHLNNVADVQKQQHSSRKASEECQNDCLAPSSSTITSSALYTKKRPHISTVTGVNAVNAKRPKTVIMSSGEKSADYPSTLLVNSSTLSSVCGTNNVASNSVDSLAPNKYRCELCNYETSFSRNLKIHQSSDKHQQNAAVCTSRAFALLQSDSSSVTASFDVCTIAKLSHLSALPASGEQLPQLLTHRNDFAPQACDDALDLSCSISNQLPLGWSTRSSPPLATYCLNSSQLLPAKPVDLSVFAQKMLMQMLSSTTTPSHILQIPASKTDQIASNLLSERVATGTFLDDSVHQTQTNTGVTERIDDDMRNWLKEHVSSSITRHSSTNSNNSTDLTKHSFLVYQCNVCRNFGTDSVDEIGAHMSRDWLAAARDDFRCKLIQQADGEEQRCSLCDCHIEDSSAVDAHCETDKHVQLARLYFHIFFAGEHRQSHAAAHHRMTSLLDKQVRLVFLTKLILCFSFCK